MAFVIIFTFTAGSALMMWLGEQINQYGIGNGISILLFAGIVARLPMTISTFVSYFQFGAQQAKCSSRHCLVPGSYLGYRLYVRRGAQDSNSIREAGGGTQDVWRPEHSHAY